jgi:membrane-bound lytic murein transglycosylase B
MFILRWGRRGQNMRDDAAPQRPPRSPHVRSILAAAFAAILLAAPALAQDGPFSAWRDGFSSTLTGEGVRSDTVASMFDGVEPDDRVIDRDRTQPEFVRPIWQYLEGAVSPERVANGRRHHDRIQPTLREIEGRFEVDSEILVAIWGLESAYGAIQGDFDVVRSLATLAWEGRRRNFAESQLRAVAQMLENGYATREQLRGSWAGAMGHTQFIPATYIERAVDFTGNGRRDIWNSEADALASAANLLARAGWSYRDPVFAEVALESGFNYAGWNESARRTVAEWAAQGVRPAGGGEFAADDLYREARLIIPAGSGGPAFLAYRNFEALLRYNNSTAYVLGVGYLAQSIAGTGSLATGWPENDPPISRSQSQRLQETLTAMGHDTGGVDGVIGPNTRRAIREFQENSGMEPDGYAGRAVFDAVMSAAGDRGL